MAAAHGGDAEIPRGRLGTLQGSWALRHQNSSLQSVGKHPGGPLVAVKELLSFQPSSWAGRRELREPGVVSVTRELPAHSG